MDHFTNRPSRRLAVPTKPNDLIIQEESVIIPPSAKMRAARYYGKEDIRIEHDVEPAPVGHGQVKVAPAFVGICGTGTSLCWQPVWPG